MGTFIGFLLTASFIFSVMSISVVTGQNAMIDYIVRNGDRWDMDQVRKLYEQVAGAGIFISLLGHFFVFIATYDFSYWFVLLIVFVHGLTIFCMAKGFSSAERTLKSEGQASD